jgi:putative ABC transport system ATP-binding protein
VALARAFSTGPKVLFADEPTGNRDARTGAGIIDLMVELNRDLGTTLVLVTHDLDLAARARRTIRLADGRIVADTAA